MSCQLLQIPPGIVGRLGQFGHRPQHINTLFLEVVDLGSEGSLLQAGRLGEPFLDADQNLVFAPGMGRRRRLLCGRPGSSTFLGKGRLDVPGNFRAEQ